MKTVISSTFVLLLLAAVSSCAQPSPSPSARSSALEPVTQVLLPGKPFQALPTRDGHWVFVSLTEGDAGGRGVAVLERHGDATTLARVIPIDDEPTGMVLLHDEALLVVAGFQRKLAFLDVAKLTTGGEGALLGYLNEDGPMFGRIHVNVTMDDRFLFVSNERAQSISVIDLAKARASAFSPAAIIGKIPVGNSPIALAFSPDERYLYTTSQTMPLKPGAPPSCRPEGSPVGTPPAYGQGAVLVVDVARATSDPATAVVATVPSGCNPVRLALSPRGDVAYVSARGDDALLAFDTAKMLSNPDRASIGRVAVGRSPVGIAVFDAGRRVAVTSSNRYAGDASDRQPVFVIDATKIGDGAAAVLGTITAGAFPREMRVTADGKTLLLTNFASKTLQFVDLEHLSLAPYLNR